MVLRNLKMQQQCMTKKHTQGVRSGARSAECLFLRDYFMVKTWTKRSKYHEYHLEAVKLQLHFVDLAC